MLSSVSFGGSGKVEIRRFSITRLKPSTSASLPCIRVYWLKLEDSRLRDWNFQYVWKNAKKIQTVEIRRFSITRLKRDRDLVRCQDNSAVEIRRFSITRLKHAYDRTPRQNLYVEIRRFSITRLKPELREPFTVVSAGAVEIRRFSITRLKHCWCIVYESSHGLKLKLEDSRLRDWNRDRWWPRDGGNL